MSAHGRSWRRAGGTEIVHCGREFGRDEVELIVDVLGRFPNLSRTEVVATACEVLGWQREGGKTRECLDLVGRLEESGGCSSFHDFARAGRRRARRAFPAPIAVSAKRS